MSRSVPDSDPARLATSAASPTSFSALFDTASSDVAATTSDLRTQADALAKHGTR